MCLRALWGTLVTRLAVQIAEFDCTVVGGGDDPVVDNVELWVVWWKGREKEKEKSFVLYRIIHALKLLEGGRTEQMREIK